MGRHGGQYDAEAKVFTSKTKVMQQHIYYIRFALQFTDMQISELGLGFAACQSKNSIRNTGWTGMRAYYD